MSTLSSPAAFVLLSLLPGLIIAVFAKKAVEFNARLYPVAYRYQSKTLMILLLRVGGVVWIALGFYSFFLKSR